MTTTTDATKAAKELLEKQQEALDKAAKTIREATKTLAHRTNDFAHDEVVPFAKAAWATSKPRLEKSVAYTRALAEATRQAIVDDVVPAVGKAVGTAVTAVELARSEQVKEAVQRYGRAGVIAIAEGRKAAVKAGKKAAKKKGGGAKVAWFLVGAVVVGTVAYAAWAASRTEPDELWTLDEEPLADAELTEA